MAGERDGAELALRFGSAETGWRWCLGSVGIDRALGVTIGTYQETTALRDAEERFQRAFEDAAHRHGHHRHRRALRARQPLAGGDARAASPRQLAGVGVRDLTHPAHHDDDREAMRALAAGERTTYSAEKRYLRADGSEAWVALRRHRRAQRRRRAAVLPLADGRHRRAPRRRARAGRERGALPHAGRRLTRRHLRHRRGRPAGLRQRAPARASSTCPARSSTAALARARAGRRPRAPRRRVPPRAGAGRARLARRARRGRHRPLGAHPHGAGLQGPQASRWASSGRSRTSPSRSPPAWRSPPARPSTGCSPSTRPTSCRATPSTAPSSTRRRWRAPCWAGTPTRCSAGRPSDLGHRPPRRRARSSSATGSRRCARSARARPPTARGAATARSCGWRRPSAPCAGPAARPLEMVCVSRDISERKSAELELAHRALHDGLTGLPNRTLFLDRLGQALRRSRRRDARRRRRLPRPRSLQGRQRLAGPQGRRPPARRRGHAPELGPAPVATRSRASAATS